MHGTTIKIRTNQDTILIKMFLHDVTLVPSTIEAFNFFFSVSFCFGNYKC